MRVVQVLAICLASLVAIFVLTSLFSFLSWALPTIESRDFYYYVLWARDRIHNDPGVGAEMYIYFPGVYLFWEAVMVTLGEHLSALQLGYLGLALANSVLVGAVVFVLNRSLFSTLLSMLFFIGTSSWADGFSGCTEHLVLFPFLLGLLVWRGSTLQSLLSHKYLTLCICLALAIFAKQQGVLLLAGVIGLALVGSVRTLRSVLIDTSLLLTVPAIAVLLVWLEAGSLSSITKAVSFARSYASHGSAILNLSIITPPLSCAALLVLVCRLLHRLNNQSQPYRTESKRMLVFCTFALLATLYQFRMRSYLHYGILTMAPLSIIVGLSCSYAVNAAHVTRTRLYLCYSLLSTIALICLGGINSLKCYAWSPLQTYLTHHCHPKGITAAERSDVTELCTQLKTGEDLLVFPTLNNYVHFYCETVPRSSPVRYTWDPSPPYTAILENAATNRVVIHHSIHQTHPQPGCKHYGCPELLSSIESKGFIPVLNLPTLTLYDRSAKE